MSPNPQLRLNLEGGPLRVNIETHDLGLAARLNTALEVRSDVVLANRRALADVVLWDTGLDGQRIPPREKNAVIALAPNEITARRCLALGIAGVIPRDAERGAVMAALIAVRYGLSVVAPDFERRRRRRRPDLSLTPRELEVLEFLSSGRSNRAIASALGISEHTAKFHVAQILGKLDAATRTEAVMTAVRLGLLAP